jgi:SAM-dependent methyltransferase
MPYPDALAEALRGELDLDGTGRLLDVGSGPGSLTHLLAPLFAVVVGADADADMVRVAAHGAAANERFVRLRADELPAGLGTFDVITVAQSLHWFASAEIAGTLHAMLVPDGALVHVGATTHEGDGNVPHDEIRALVKRWLGSEKRAGRGFRTWEGQDPRDVIDRGPFRNRRELEIRRNETFARSEDDVVASVFSLSAAAPHLFGDRVHEFEAELRDLLRGRGPFHERPRGITLTLWNPSHSQAS